MQKTFFLKIVKFLSIFTFASFCFPFFVYGATIDFLPSSISRNSGDIFTVIVQVSSSDKSVNAVSGTLSFPQDKIEVLSLSKTDSIINLWVQEPSFSNSQGTINFEGVILNPGFTGNKGNILSIRLKAKSFGDAHLKTSGGSILANDGLGTNILTEFKTAVFSIIQKKEQIKPEIIPVETISSFDDLFITSSTHDDQSKWYANSRPEFSWSLPEDTLETRILINKSPQSLPKTSSPSPINSYRSDILSDGTHYFSLQVRTKSGWGKVSRYKVNIDTTSPKPFSVEFPNGMKGIDPQIVISFNTTDEESGIAKYEIKVGNKELLQINSSASLNWYFLPSQLPGTHSVVVTAIDEAGNTKSASAEFVIVPIEAPSITQYKEEIESGDIIKISGKTYPNSNVFLSFKDSEGNVYSEESDISNITGDFSVVVTKRFDSGIYTFTARVVDKNDAKSEETKNFIIRVNSNLLFDITTLVLNYLSVIVLLIFISVGIFIFVTYIWYRSVSVILGLRRRGREAEQVLGKSFDKLKEDIRTHVFRLKETQRERVLTSEEISFLEKFEAELGQIKNVANEEVENISGIK